MMRARVGAIWVFVTLMALCALAVHVFAVVPLVDKTQSWPVGLVAGTDLCLRGHRAPYGCTFGSDGRPTHSR